MTLSESQAERVIGAFSAGADWALAARILSIPRSTLRRAIEADAGLMERVEDARAQADEVVIKSLYTKATVDKDTTAMIFWLKNRRRNDWSDRRDPNLSSEDIHVTFKFPEPKRDVVTEPSFDAVTPIEVRALTGA